MMFVKVWSVFQLVVLYCCFYLTYSRSVVDNYLRPCSEDFECLDFRLVCHENKSLCHCTRFYYWNSITRECHLNSSDLKLWLDEQSNRTDTGDDSSIHSHLLFYVQAIAGAAATVALSIVSVVICSIAFCNCKNNEENLKIIEHEEKIDVIPSTSNK